MLSPELTRLTRNFHTRPGASLAVIASWRALVKDVPLPADYLEFMCFSNGAYGQTGDDGLWIRLDPLEDVLPITRGHRMPDGLLLIGGTRLGDGLALDARSAQTQIVTLRACELIGSARFAGAKMPENTGPIEGRNGINSQALSLSWWGAHEVLDPLGPSLEMALQALETMGPLPVPWAIRSGPRPDIGFVPTPQPMVDAMLTAADLRPGEMLYDLGCGDGRVVITAAKKYGARGVGFDLDVELIQVARAAAVAAGVRHSATFRRADLFTVDLRPADVVSLYLLRDMNARLLPQLKQLKPGARVVSYEFEIPGVPAARSALTEYQPGVRGRVLVWDAPF